MFPAAWPVLAAILPNEALSLLVAVGAGLGFILVAFNLHSE